MTPGPEMDALVAEKVMGLKPSDAHDVVDEDCGDMRCLCCGQAWRVSEDEPDRCVARYSTFIGAAWTVVEKIEAELGTKDRPLIDEEGRSREKGHFTLTGPYLYNKWTAGWRERDDEYWLQSAEGLTAPEAICRAALKACGVPTE